MRSRFKSMEAKTGSELAQAMHQINQDEQIQELAKDDPDAILLHDKNESVINTAYASDIDCGYANASDYLDAMLEANGNSLDKMADELGYTNENKFDFILDLMAGDESMTDTLADIYDGEKLEDLNV